MGLLRTKKLRKFLSSLLLVLAVLASACHSERTPSKETLVWRKLGSWSGHGNTQTESFLSETGGMRVTWETRNEGPPGAGTFHLSIHSAVSGRTLGVAADHKGAGRAVAYISEDPHNCYAVVESANIDWTFTVEEAFPATIEDAK
jgi:hypothetical protein